MSFCHVGLVKKLFDDLWKRESAPYYRFASQSKQDSVFPLHDKSHGLRLTNSWLEEFQVAKYKQLRKFHK